MPEPKVRFKMDDGSSFPAWNDVVLGDIATRVTRKNTYGETDRPLTIASIEGLVDQRTYFGKTIASKDMSGYFLLKNGEYAYNKSYSAGYDYGSIKRLDKYDMGALSTLYICFALNEDQNTDFYNCYFNGLSWYSQMPQICAEGARNHGLLNVSPNDFFKIQLSVPSNKEEQQKIAEFLSSVDEVIAASEEEVANLETQKKAVMKKIFSQEVRFKKADGSDFPEWEKDILDNLCEYRRGSFPQPYGLEEWYDENKGMPFIQVADVNDDMSVNANTKRHISELAKPMSVFVPKGTLIITLQGTIGKVAITSYDAYVDRTLLLFQKVFEGLLLNYFKYALFMCFDVEKKTADGGIIKTITKETLGSFVISLPCLEEQRLIAGFLSDFDEAIAAAKKELELWKELKKGLLQQMFV